MGGAWNFLKNKQRVFNKVELVILKNLFTRSLFAQNPISVLHPNIQLAFYQFSRVFHGLPKSNDLSSFD